MTPAQQTYVQNILKHVYISPLELCNLNCKICYTKKMKNILSNNDILKFIDRYIQKQKIEVITFCGGEVFTLKTFPQLINTLTKRGIFIQIITNGTIDTLNQLQQPNNITLIVSIDGLQKYHDKNRGEGSFATSLQFLKKAKQLGFHI